MKLNTTKGVIVDPEEIEYLEKKIADKIKELNEREEALEKRERRYLIRHSHDWNCSSLWSSHQDTWLTETQLYKRLFTEVKEEMVRNLNVNVTKMRFFGRLNLLLDMKKYGKEILE